MASLDFADGTYKMNTSAGCGELKQNSESLFDCGDSSKARRPSNLLFDYSSKLVFSLKLFYEKLVGKFVSGPSGIAVSKAPIRDTYIDKRILQVPIVLIWK